MPPDHPAYPYTQWLRQAVPLDSEPGRLWRRHQESQAEAERVLSVGRRERQLQLAAALDLARADPANWWRVALWLSADDTGHLDGTIFSHDLTTRPGWSLLDDQERCDVLDLGIRYLTTHRLQPSGWIGRATVPDQVVADWSGVYLLTTLASHDPERLTAIDSQVWRTWARPLSAPGTPATPRTSRPAAT